MWRTYGGAVAVIAGIAAFIEAHVNRPIPAFPPPGTFFRPAQETTPASGLSPTDYHLLLIGAWALVILGALTVVLGLIRYWRSA
jgi:hypothetical protein